MSLHVRLLTDAADLEAHAADWDRLADAIPFRTSTWASAWWRHYGAPPEDRKRKTGLYVAAVFDDADNLRAIAPWSRRYSLTEGWVLEWLGDGEVCSDYLGLLCDDDAACDVAETIADWLCDGDRSAHDRWDLLRLDAVDAQDRATTALVEALESRQCRVHRRAGPRCWRLALPESWDEYLQCLSKSHRKQVRRLERNMLESGRAVLHTARRPAEVPPMFNILIDLHQRRRAFLDEPGCFASPRFKAFHRDVSLRLAERGGCLLHCLEIDGSCAAAEYHFRGNGLNFAYQAGIDPERIEDEPGNLITVAVLKQAIERGDCGMDFLRGDETYKSHFRAEPRPSVRFRIAAPRWRANYYLLGWTAALSVKSWLTESRGSLPIEL